MISKEMFIFDRDPEVGDTIAPFRDGKIVTGKSSYMARVHSIDADGMSLIPKDSTVPIRGYIRSFKLVPHYEWGILQELKDYKEDQPLESDDDI